MQSFFVDFTVIPMCGTLTSYVLANSPDEAAQAIRLAKNLFEDHSVNEIVGVYPIDEIPCDCPYVDQQGILQSARGQQ